MRTRNALRLLLIVLAGTLALPIVASVVALRGPASGARAADADAAVVATVSVPTEPVGVAVNPNTNLIYVTNFNNGYNGNVSVIDGASNTVVATMAVASGLWGLALNPNTNLVYVPSYYDNNVSVIDGDSDTVVATVAVGTQPDYVALNRNTQPHLRVERLQQRQRLRHRRRQQHCRRHRSRRRVTPRAWLSTPTPTSST